MVRSARAISTSLSLSLWFFAAFSRRLFCHCRCFKNVDLCVCFSQLFVVSIYALWWRNLFSHEFSLIRLSFVDFIYVLFVVAVVVFFLFFFLLLLIFFRKVSIFFCLFSSLFSIISCCVLSVVLVGCYVGILLPRRHFSSFFPFLFYKICAVVNSNYGNFFSSVFL